MGEANELGGRGAMSRMTATLSTCGAGNGEVRVVSWPTGFLLGAVLALGACTQPSAAPESEESGLPDVGLKLADMDRSVSPGEDFWRHANGLFLRDAVIPDDADSVGTGEQVKLETDRRLLAMFESPDKDGSQSKGSKQARQLYDAYLDQARRNEVGDRSLRDDLGKLSAVSSKEDLARFLAERDGLRTLPFELSIGTNYRKPTSLVLTISQGGLAMPQHHYLGSDSKLQEYTSYLGGLFALVDHRSQTAIRPDGPGKTGQAAKSAAELEHRLARQWMSLLELRNLQKQFTVMSVAELAADAPGFPWQEVLGTLGLGRESEVAVVGLDSVVSLSSAWSKESLGDLKDWAAARMIDRAAPYLSSQFVERHHQFHDVVLRGVSSRTEYQRAALKATASLMPFAVGRMYVDRYFNPETKRQVEEMVVHIRAAMARRIEDAQWLSEATRRRSLTKLQNLRVEVGYPAHWPDFAGLDISGLPLLDAVKKVQAFNWQRQVAGLGLPRDPEAGTMPPHWVSAGFTGDGVVFAAAILQPPYFQLNAPLEVNYGAIGATIGHEITHAFDDAQRVFDENGALAEADWWTEEDIENFNARAEPLIAQFERYEPLLGLHINGRRTLGENLADLSGLSIAFEAWRDALGEQEPPVVDGLTGEQRFFIAYAQQWRRKSRPESMKHRLLGDVHSPAEWRVNGVVRNLPAWQRAFDVQPGMAMYESDADLVRVW